MEVLPLIPRFKVSFPSNHAAKVVNASIFWISMSWVMLRLMWEEADVFGKSRVRNVV